MQWTKKQPYHIRLLNMQTIPSSKNVFFLLSFLSKYELGVWLRQCAAPGGPRKNMHSHSPTPLRAFKKKCLTYFAGMKKKTDLKSPTFTNKLQRNVKWHLLWMCHLQFAAQDVQNEGHLVSIYHQLASSIFLPAPLAPKHPTVFDQSPVFDCKTPCKSGETYMFSV